MTQPTRKPYMLVAGTWGQEQIIYEADTRDDVVEPIRALYRHSGIQYMGHLIPPQIPHRVLIDLEGVITHDPRTFERALASDPYVWQIFEAGRRHDCGLSRPRVNPWR